jgi:hypothetical protein
MNKKIIIVYSMACLGGSLIWAISPLVTGHSEPWDTEESFKTFYPLSLFIIGMVGTILHPPGYVKVAFSVWGGASNIYVIIFTSWPILNLRDSILFYIHFFYISRRSVSVYFL